MKKVISQAVLSLFVLLIPVTMVFAKEDIKAVSESTNPATECFALDVIFIIDQSNSMSYGSLKSDPTEQREKAVEAMTNWLIENALDHCKNSRHQVGVISFGTESRIDLPLTEIAPKSFDSAVALQKRLEEKIVADGLGDTLPMEAFVLARKLFDESALRQIGQRKQVIIMLTDGLIADGRGNDGKGYVLPTQELANFINDNFKFDSTLKLREACIQERVTAHGGDFDNVPYEQVNQCLQEYDVDNSAYLNSTYVYVVLMNFREEGWPAEIRNIYKSVADSHMGEMMDFHEAGVENRNAIPDFFRTVLASMVGVPSGRVQCGPVAVNPYLEKATFVFYKFSEDTKVNLRYTDADGKVFEISDNIANDPSGFDVIEYESYGPNERYTINNPYPGIWHIESDRCSSDGVSAFYQEVKINPGGFSLPITFVQQYDLEPYYDVSAPVYLTYEMRDEEGEVIEISPNAFFNIDLVATVTGPTGEVNSYTLAWNRDESRFIAKEPLLVRYIGDYHVSIKGETLYYPGIKAPITGALATTFNKTQILFQHEQLTFSVTEVKPFIIKQEIPQQNQVMNQIHETILKGWPLKVKPIVTSIRVDWREASLDRSIGELINDPNNAFESWIEFRDGSTTERIKLRTDPDNPQQLTGAFDDIDSTEPMIIHTELVGETNAEFRPDFRKISVNFSRSDDSIFSRPEFYRILVLILAGIMFIVSLIQFLAHYDPVYGTLEFYLNEQSIGKLTIPAKKKKTKFRRSDLNSRHIKSLEVAFTPYSKPIDDEYEEITRSVRLTGVTECDIKNEKIGSTLDPESREIYCSNHPEYEVSYRNPYGGKKPKLQPGIYMLLPIIPVILIVLFFIM